MRPCFLFCQVYFQHILPFMAFWGWEWGTCRQITVKDACFCLFVFSLMFLASSLCFLGHVWWKKKKDCYISWIHLNSPLSIHENIYRVHVYYLLQGEEGKGCLIKALQSYCTSTGGRALSCLPGEAHSLGKSGNHSPSYPFHLPSATAPLSRVWVMDFFISLFVFLFIVIIA